MTKTRRWTALKALIAAAEIRDHAVLIDLGGHCRLPAGLRFHKVVPDLHGIEDPITPRPLPVTELCAFRRGIRVLKP